MSKELVKVWSILVPISTNMGENYSIQDHYAWDNYVIEITNGLSVFPVIKGKWRTESGELYLDRMIPVTLACTRSEIENIADFTAKHYKQLAVMFWKVSDEVEIRHYPDKKLDKWNKYIIDGVNREYTNLLDHVVTNIDFIINQWRSNA